LAPFFALLNNVIEIRLDAYKFISTRRRPLAQRVQDIGAWFGILQALTYISVATNAITIALASDFIPHLVYKYGYSDNRSLQGFVNFTLTVFKTADWGNMSSPDWVGPESYKTNETAIAEFPDTCYFKAKRTGSPDYELDEAWYHILAARLAFVLVFEHFVMGLTGIMAVLIPDVPTDVRTQIQREHLLAREILFEKEEGMAATNPDDHGDIAGGGQDVERLQRRLSLMDVSNE